MLNTISMFGCVIFFTLLFRVEKEFLPFAFIPLLWSGVFYFNGHEGLWNCIRRGFIQPLTGMLIVLFMCAASVTVVLSGTPFITRCMHQMDPHFIGATFVLLVLETVRWTEG